MALRLKFRRSLPLEQRPDLCNVNRGGVSPDGLEFFDAVFTDWLGSPSTFLVVPYRCRKITSNAHTNSKWRLTDRM